MLLFLDKLRPMPSRILLRFKIAMWASQSRPLKVCRLWEVKCLPMA